MLSLSCLLASGAEVREKMACAQLCPGARLYSGLIHLAFLIVSVGSLFVSSISLRWLGLLGSKVVGILGTMIGYTCSLMQVSGSNLLVNVASFAGMRSHSTASLVLVCRIMLPFLSLITCCIVTFFGGAGSIPASAFSALSLISYMFRQLSSPFLVSRRICLAFFSSPRRIPGSFLGSV